MLPYFKVNAQSEALKSALKEVTDIKDSNIESPESRVSAILKIIDLSRLEVEDLIKKLSSLENLDKNYSDLRDSFLSILSDYLIYLDNAEIEANNPELSPDDLKLLANNLKQWRDAKYNNTLKKTVNFIWVLREADLLDTAHNRLDKISTDLKKAKNSRFIKIADLMPPLEKATTLLKEAKMSSKLAHELLFATTTPENYKSSTLDDVVEETLSKIKSAYQEFFKMNSLIKEMLGL